MKKNFIALLSLLISAGAASAQEALWLFAPVESPVVNSDSTVTLSIFAPNASKVAAHGFGMNPLELTRSDNGTWSVTTPKMKPDLYTYSFDVDGVRTIDPANAYTARDISMIFSEVIVPGGNADLYAPRDVPHGTVSKVWYPSLLSTPHAV